MASEDLQFGWNKSLRSVLHVSTFSFHKLGMDGLVGESRGSNLSFHKLRMEVLMDLSSVERLPDSDEGILQSVVRVSDLDDSPGSSG
jgi:hypothetical protein